MSCVKIRLKHIPNVSPIYLEADGYMYLDLNTNYELSSYKRLTELTDLNQLPFDYVLETEVPASPKNNAILANFLHGSKQYIDAYIYNGSFWISGYSLRVSRGNSENLNLSILHSSYIWAKTLNSTFVKDLRIQKVLRGDEVKCIDPNEENPIPSVYDKTDPNSKTVYFPIIDYGDLRSYTDEFRSNRAVVISEDNSTFCFDNTGSNQIDLLKKTPYRINNTDLRPLHFINPLIHKMFCVAGYQLVSPILDSDYGRSILTYLLDNTLSTKNLNKRFVTPDNLEDLFIGYSRVNLTPTENLTLDIRFVGSIINVFITSPITLTIPNGSDITGSMVIINSPVSLSTLTVLGAGFGSTTVASGTQIMITWNPETNEWVIDAVELYTGFLDRNPRPLMIFNDLGVWDISGALNFKIPRGVSVSSESQVLVYVGVFQDNTLVQYLGGQEYLDLKRDDDASQFFQYQFDFSDVHIKDRQEVQVRVYVNKALIQVILDLENEVQRCADPDIQGGITILNAEQKHHFFWRRFPDEGYWDTSVIQKDLKNLDLLKGITHILNLKFYTDHVNRRVYALQPEEVDLFGEVLEGFFDFTEDTLELVDDTYDVLNDPSNVKKVIVKFKNDLHKGMVYIDKDAEEDVTLENPLFDATYLQRYGYGSAPVEGEGEVYNNVSPIRLEHYFPNMSGELSNVGQIEITLPIGIQQKSSLYKQFVSDRRSQVFDISPRILLNYGKRSQTNSDKVNGLFFDLSSSGFSFYTKLLPTAAHFHSKLSAEDTIGGTIGFTAKSLLFDFDVERLGVTLPYPNVFNFHNTLLNILHHSYILNTYKGLNVNYRGWLNHKQFYQETFRGVRPIQHLGKPYNVIIQEILDFKSCSASSTELILKEYRKHPLPCWSADNYEDLDPEFRNEIADCTINNAPAFSLRYDLVEHLMVARLTGLNTDVITSVFFEYSSDNENWDSSPNIDLLSAYIPALNTITYVRATVVYENCPITVTGTMVYDPCSEWLDRLTAQLFVNDEQSTCVIAGITFPEDVDYDVVSFEVDLGEGYVDYIANTLLCDIENDVTFKLVTQIHDCPEYEQTITLLYEPRCLEEDEIEQIGLVFENNEIVRIGNLPLGVMFDRIYYQISEDAINWPIAWLEYLGGAIPEGFLRARRIIEFCGECDDICTQIYYNFCSETELSIECIDKILTLSGHPEEAEITWTLNGDVIGTGETVMVTIDGTYYANIVYENCTSSASYPFVAPNAGTPIDNPIIIDDL